MKLVPFITEIGITEYINPEHIVIMVVYDDYYELELTSGAYIRVSLEDPNAINLVSGGTL